MKEAKKLSPIPVKDLVIEGVYKTHTSDLVQIKNINIPKNQLHIYNITESCNIFNINLEKHYLVERIR